MNDTRVSVIMLAFNRPQFMGRAIQSVIDQDVSNWELIVVHDGLNEPITALMQEWVRRDSRIRYFHRPKPGNIGQATNFGLKEARGVYVAIQDDDDYWIPKDKLRKQAAFLDSHPDYVGCSGGVIVVNQFDGEKMRFLKPEQDAEIRRRALWANPMRHSAGMYRMEIVRAFGGYDEQLPQFQDWDLWLKLGEKGKLYNFQEYLTAYRVWERASTFENLKGNGASAVQIVWRHRRTYSGFIPAMVLALAYYFYGRTPAFFRKTTWKVLAATKRKIFSVKEG